MTDAALGAGLWSVGGKVPCRQDEPVMAAPRVRSRGSISKTSSSVTLGLGIAACLLAGCSGGEATLLGMTRDQPLAVGSARVSDVTDQGRYSDHDPEFTMKARPGGLLVVYFGYTNCPDLCPTTLALVRSALRELGGQGDTIDLAMVTVDPDRDTPEVLNGFLASFIDRFHALRPASADELKAVESAFLASSTITTSPAGKIEVGHTATTYVVDENGSVVVEWPFGVDKDTMIHDLRILGDRS